MIFQVPGSREEGALPLHLAEARSHQGEDHMRLTTIPAVLLAASMVACATGKQLDTSRPIQMDDGTYRQGNEPLLMTDLEDKLAAHPAAGPKLDGYQAKKWTGVLLGGVGGGLVGWNVTDNLMKKGEKSWTPTLVGAGAILLSIPFAVMASGQMHSAAEAYNGSFAQSQSSVLSGALPYIAVVPEPSGGRQCRAGFTMSF